MAISYEAHCALFWVPVLLSLATVVVRLFVRSRLRNFGPDDLFISVSVVLQFVAITIAQAMATEIEFSKSPKMPRYLQMTATQAIFIYACLLFGKASVAFLLLRVLGTTGNVRRWFVYITLAILGALTVPAMVTSVMPSCKLKKSSWLVDRCVDPKIITGFNQTWNFYSAIFDIMYSFLPITFIHKLKVSNSKKLYLALSLSIGWIAAAFSILRAVSGYVWPGNYEQQAYMTQIATNLEPALVIICGSVASLTPLFDYFCKGRPLEPRSGFSGFRSAKASRNGSGSGAGSPLGKAGSSSVTVRAA